MWKEILKKIYLAVFLFITLIAIETLTGCGSERKTDTQFADMLGSGWNLGNSLECVDFNQLSETGRTQFRNDYQAMLIYSSEPYSGWDASDVFYVKWGGKTIQWNISESKSDKNSKTGSFSIQIFNTKLKDSGSDTVKVNLSEALFTKADGSSVSLDSWNGSYDVQIKDSKSENISFDIGNIEGLSTTGDLKYGTLSVHIELSDYPDTVKAAGTEDSVTYYETLWGNRIVTKEVIDTVKEAGFKTVRVPVSYYDHLMEDGTIDKTWLERVEQVVSYVLDDGMYCIIDLHHDTGNNSWIVADSENLEENLGKVELLWKQIADYFKDYDEKLIFEGLNEVLDAEYDWGCEETENLQAVNELNQKFVDTVRKSEGKNTQRYLIVNTYASSNSEKVLTSFKLPKDSVENRILVDVHSYEKTEEVVNVFERIRQYLTDKGVPVIIGEFGRKHNAESNNIEDQLAYARIFVEQAKESGIPYCWWDDGGDFENKDAVDKFTLLNRTDLSWYFPEIVSVLVGENK